MGAQTGPYNGAVAEQHEPEGDLRLRMRQVIFDADTGAARTFDIVLLWTIVASVTVVMLDSVHGIGTRYHRELYIAEWCFTIIFTIEYALRIWSVGQAIRYMTSFFGLVDLLSILPTYVGLLFGGTESLMVIRSLRLLRVFRVLKLAHLVGEARVLMRAVLASRAKISVFIGSVLVMTAIMGAVMYLVEGPEHGFTSIPRGMYWAIVTMTTVGYGDISPQTNLGQFIASIVMIMGYGIIAVPTGIVSVELAQATRAEITARGCGECSEDGHDLDADYCKYCGAAL